MRHILNPTDPDAGTNRTNAVSRDNLMNGVGLGYDGNSNDVYINNVGTYGRWWASTVGDESRSYGLDIFNDGYLQPSGTNGRNIGRAVRCVYYLHW